MKDGNDAKMFCIIDDDDDELIEREVVVLVPFGMKSLWNGMNESGDACCYDNEAGEFGGKGWV